jgi:hypothetical protein
MLATNKFDMFNCASDCEDIHSKSTYTNTAGLHPCWDSLSDYRAGVWLL